MPAPEAHSNRPSLGHVNLMVDTFIANAQLDDLRTIVRDLLASGIPNVGSAFSAAARTRMAQCSSVWSAPGDLFTTCERCVAAPTAQLSSTITHARCLYGSGLGFAALKLLASIVRGTIGLRWDGEGDMITVLTEIDVDISQAIQSSKEEIETGRMTDSGVANETIQGLRRALLDSKKDTESWGGDFPFDRALSSVEFWKTGSMQNSGGYVQQGPRL